MTGPPEKPPNFKVSLVCGRNFSGTPAVLLTIGQWEVSKLSHLSNSDIFSPIPG